MKLKLLSLGFVLAVGMLPNADAFELAPKTSIRSGASLINNSVSGLGTSSLGGFEVLGHLFLTPKLAAGLGYKSEFDLVDKIVPLKGFEIQGRYYFLGAGTRVSHSSLRFDRETRTRWNMYASGTLYLAKYFINTVGNPIEGDANLISFGVGMEYAFSKRFELVAELFSSVLSFSSDPSQVRLLSTGVALGLGYVY